MPQLPLPLAHEEPEPWMLDEVRELERHGLSYADAFDEVFGVPPTNEWEDDLDGLLGGSTWQ
jgi:hypothetical protein